MKRNLIADLSWIQRLYRWGLLWGLVFGFVCEALIALLYDAFHKMIYKSYGHTAFDKHCDDLIKYHEFAKVWWKILMSYFAFQFVRFYQLEH